MEKNNSFLPISFKGKVKIFKIKKNKYKVCLFVGFF